MRSIFVLAFLSVAFAAISNDLVKTIPQAPANLPFSMYSGYLKIPNSQGRQIHYVFFTSQNNPKTDPLVLWLNGGPGCSSMEGAFMENGPLVFSEHEMKMSVNPYSWNLNASMLYLEAPAGVGYSIMGNIANNNTNDNQTAADNLQALLLWFQGFPEYKPNVFYVSGESYAGIYVPTLVYNILNYNTANPTTKINIQGFLVGNGVTDWNVDADNAFAEFGWWHGLFGYDIWNSWVNNNCSAFSDDPICVKNQNTMYDLFTDVNFYDIYRPCVYPDFDYTASPAYAKFSNAVKLGGVVNCVPDIGLTQYLNLPNVRTAFHISPNLGAWQECTNLNYDTDYTRGSIYLYPILLNPANGLRVRFYSGDTDAAVPTIGSRQWIENLALKGVINVTNEWREWPFNQQVGGMVINYAYSGSTTPNFTFMTIRGTGHMSIQWKRPQGYHMFLTFIQGIDP